MTSPRRIAVVGCGVMGGWIARRLAGAGFDVAAWNRDPAKAAALEPFDIRPAGRPSEALADRDAVISLLTDGPANDAVLFGPDDSGRVPATLLRPGGIVAVMGTISVHEARAQAERSAALGRAYVDAPVSGGEVGARDGTLTIMAGGAEATVAALADVFAALGRATRIGEAGAGTLAKLANQTIVAVTLCAVSEALLFAERGGADPAAVRAALMGGFAGSAILDQHGGRMLRRDWKPGGIAVNQVKDQKALLRVATENGLEMPFARLALQVFQDLCAHGDGLLDHSAVYREVRRRSGLDPD